jgi:hypothetical protein
MVRSRQSIFSTFSVVFAVLLGTSLLPTTPDWFSGSNRFGLQPVLAQRIRPDGIWKQIYQRLPDLPLENQYVSKETGQVDSENTLVGRLIRYHLYSKGRPPFYRLDWKITLAEYLEVHRIMEEVGYPSANSLNTNPVGGDVSAIKRLNRAQRDALIQSLVDAFTPQSINRTRSNSDKPENPYQPPATLNVNPLKKPARGPGAAQLLEP